MSPNGTERQVLQADLTWVEGRFERDLQVVVGGDGRIAQVGHLGLEPSHRLPERALIPGFVNAHSHAFQRGLRGRGESFPRGAGSFWSWREEMYTLADGLNRDGFFQLCRQAFREMREAGITSAGEFHYLHHDVPHDGAFDELVLAAAQAAGLRIVLLSAFYRTGGIGKPLEARQRRFATPSVEAYLERLETLRRLTKDLPTQGVGVVAHSVRAASPEEIRALAAYAAAAGLPFHIHLEEQPREIDDCREAYGLGPLALINRDVPDLGVVTAVHCTHSTPEDLARFLGGGGRICLCPLTEANLGDGLADLPSMMPWADRLCLGSDSNARISMLEEMRWLEYGQRLRGQRRGVAVDAAGELAPVLFAAATTGGAAALSLPVGAIHPGAWADLTLVDLGASCLTGWTESSLANALALGAGDEAIVATAVGGRWRQHRGEAHPALPG